MNLTHTHIFSALGGQWKISTVEPVSPSEQTTIDHMVADFDASYSRFKPTSLVSKMRAEGPGTYNFPDSIIPLYETYVALERATDGRVNPFVGEALEQQGYDPSYRLRPDDRAPLAAPSFARNTSLTGMSIKTGVTALMDIGAAGKGLLVDMLSSYIAASHPNYTIDGASDLFVGTTETHSVELEHPQSPGSVIGTLRLSQQALASSAINRRLWGPRLHHILDARTGQAITTPVVATWAIADSALIADALSTALYHVSPQQLSEEFGAFYYIVMNNDGTVAHNINTIGELYS